LQSVDFSIYRAVIAKDNYIRIISIHSDDTAYSCQLIPCIVKHNPKLSLISGSSNGKSGIPIWCALRLCSL